VTGPRLLLAAPPFAGHLNPLLTLGRGLRARGYDIRFATGAAKADAVRAHGFEVHPLLADDPGVFDRISDTPGPVRSNPLLLTRQLRANLALLPRADAELDALVLRDGHDAVLADFTAPVAGLVAERHGLPWLTTMPTPLALETRTGTPSYLGGWGPARHVGHRVRDAVGRTATRAAKRGMQVALARQFGAAGVGVYRPDGSEAAYSPTAVLGLGMTELELPRDWPAAFRMIGPVTATPEPWPQPPVLPDGRLVLVTLGTHLHWAKRDLVAQARGLVAEAGGRTVVVSLGDAARRQARPVHVEPGLHVFGHLPYDAVLPRCDAVVHHGGAGILYSAVRAGVPAVVCPQDYDQFDFAARVVAAGAGVRVRRLGTRAAADALRSVLAADRAPLVRLAAAAAAYDPVGAVDAAVSALLAGRPLPPAPGRAAPDAPAGA
jgi:UDP:flavonoid glycosyltransferase YjiC (YdhE family)